MRITAVPVRLIPLAVLAAVTSPTAIAVVLVILNRPRPVRLLMAYLVGSLLASLLIGIAIVAGLKATGTFAPRRGASVPMLAITFGVVILLSAVWAQSERSAGVRRRAAERRAREKAARSTAEGANPRRSSQILREGSVGLIAGLGVAMHLPGLLYLAGLAEIAHAQARTARVLVLLVLFNIIMLAPIEVPLVGSMVAPEATQQTIERLDTFIVKHRREALLLAAVLAGGYLVVSGIVGLLS